VELASKPREARKRNEGPGLSDEEAAFYDALAGESTRLPRDPHLGTEWVMKRGKSRAGSS
jgi:hypothetical protein